MIQGHPHSIDAHRGPRHQDPDQERTNFTSSWATSLQSRAKRQIMRRHGNQIPAHLLPPAPAAQRARDPTSCRRAAPALSAALVDPYPHQPWPAPSPDPWLETGTDSYRLALTQARAAAQNAAD
ncbi:hypothetical protein ACIGO6_39090 [Streptomyces sp. NPDC053750]|uniref:hypothetical protein n=1 Tax=Streptomyces sp. NPDC053750 TaxID=3365714 RepID=UPI0037CE3E21